MVGVVLEEVVSVLALETLALIVALVALIVGLAVWALAPDSIAVLVASIAGSIVLGVPTTVLPTGVLSTVAGSVAVVATRPKKPTIVE